MANLITRNLSRDVLKVRWNETYVSSALNIQMGALKPGVYHGFEVRQTAGSASKSFRLYTEAGGYSLLLHRGATGRCVAIHLEDDLLFDMSARFTAVGGAMPAAETWYVWAAAQYSETVETAGQIYVTDELPAPADAVRIATIVMPMGATTILDAYVRVDGEHQDNGLATTKRVVEKSLFIAGVAGRTTFQIIGRVHLRGITSNGGYEGIDGPLGHIRLHNVGSGSLLTNNSGQLIGGYFYHDEACTQAVVIDNGLDADRCVTNPYVRLQYYNGSMFVPTSYNSPFNCKYQTVVAMDDPGDVTGPFGHFRPDCGSHIDLIAWSAVDGGAGDSLSANGLLGGGLHRVLLDLINNRVRSTGKGANPTTWTRIWRSDNTTDGTLDVDKITRDTMSVYVHDDGIVTICGAYLSGDGEVHTPHDILGTTDIKASFWGKGSYFGDVRVGTDRVHVDLSRRSVGGQAWNLNDIDDGDGAGWTGCVLTSRDGVNTSFGSSVLRVGKGVSGGLQYRPILVEGSVGDDDDLTQLRMYIGYNHDLWIVSNAKWNAVDDVWVGVRAGYDAQAFVMNNNGMAVYRMDSDAALFMTGWSVWRQKYTIFGSNSDLGFVEARQSCASVSGETYEVVLFGCELQNHTAINRYIYDCTALNFRSRWASPPLETVVLMDVDGNWNDGLVDHTLTDAIALETGTDTLSDNWGMYLQVTSRAQLTPAQQMNIRGRVTFIS